MPIKRMMPLVGATLALGLAACHGESNTSGDNTTTVNLSAIESDIGNTTSETGNAVGNAFDNAVDAVTPTPTGQAFVDKAAKSDAFEIAAAKLALDHAASAKVKDFARMMITDHGKSTAKIKAAAARATPAITPDPTLTDDQNNKLADLGKLNGADFDTAYVDNQIDAHKTALALMQDYAGNGDVPSLKAAAGEIAPVVRKHLDHVRALKQ